MIEHLPHIDLSADVGSSAISGRGAPAADLSQRPAAAADQLMRVASGLLRRIRQAHSASSSTAVVVLRDRRYWPTTLL